MIVRTLVPAALCLLYAACAAVSQPSNEELRRQVADTERAFAKTMAERDAERFITFVSEEAVFFSGEKALRGKRAISEAWARFYQKPEAPFSWEPDQVEVLGSGKLALSTGPVRDSHGKLIARFTSIWREEAPGIWRIVFDKGSEVCECGGPAKP
jgi:ketosteroid isomerase-like protein